jgi:hypothetical protein
MKLDKDFLIKHKFWVVLSGGLFLTLLAIFFLLVIAPGAINKKRKQVEDDWGKVKNAQGAKNPTYIEAVSKVREAEKGNETVAWRRGYLSQKGLEFWPKEFANRYEFEDGLFATEIAVQDKNDLAALPEDEPKEEKTAKEEKAEKKQEKNGKNGKKEEGPPELVVKGKFHGKLVEFNSEFIIVEGRGKAGTKKFHRLRDEHMKVASADGKDVSLFPDLKKKEGSLVAVSYFQGRRFYDPLTRAEQGLYTETYATQLKPILKEAGPLNEMDQILVQFPNYRWGKELPPAEAPFFRHVKDWDLRDKDPALLSEEIWLAQEDLWIQREMFRIIKKANDSVANFEPVVANNQPVPGRFQNPYWQIDVLGVQGDQIKIRLTNRLERPQAVNVNFRVQFAKGGPFVAIAPVKDNDPLPPAGTKDKDGKAKDSIERDLKIESEEPGKQVVGVRQVLTWETAAVRRIDHVSIGYSGGESSLSQRNAHRSLRAYVAKKPEEKPAAADAGPMNPTGEAGGTGKPRLGVAGPGGFPGSGGLAGAAGQTAGMTEYHRLVSDRYFDVTPQARRVPVAVVLIVDPAHVTRVETAFANSPLRFLINQVLMNRYPRSVRPDTSSDTVVAESSGSGPGGFPLAPMMPSFGGRYPGGPGRYPGAPPGPLTPSTGGTGVPMMSRPMFPGAGRPRMPMIPGAGDMTGPGYPGMGGPGMYGPGYGQSPSLGGNEEAEANIELVLYGIISLYEPYPPRPPLPSAEGSPAPTPPAANP